MAIVSFLFVIIEYNMVRRIYCLFILFSFWLWTPLHGQNSDDAKEVTQTYIFQNANIIVNPSQTIELGDILIKDGLIVEVGKNILAPFDAKVIDVDSQYIYPAFIINGSFAGIKKPESKRPDVNDPGNPPNDLAGITPYKTVRSIYKENLESSLKDLADVGIAYANIVPRGDMLPGKSSLVLTKGKGVQDLFLKDETGVYFQFNPASRIYPATLIGVMAKFRDLIQNAKLTSAYSTSYNENPNGLPLPDSDEVSQALSDASNGKEVIYTYAPKVKDINRAILLKNELGLSMHLIGVKQGQYLMEDVKDNFTNISISLDIPEEMKIDSSLEGTQKALQERKFDAYQNELKQAQIMLENGLMFSFSSMDLSSSDIKKNLHRIVDSGLTSKDALQALTTTPSKQLGIERIAGSLEKGKLANLFIVDKPYFEKESAISYTLINNHLNKIEKKKKSDKKVKNIDGTWSYTLDFGIGEMSGSFIIENSESEKTEVKVESNDMPDEEFTGENVKFEENKLSFSVSIQGVVYQVDLEFSEEEFEGNVSSVETGSTKITGSKTPKE